MTSRMYLYMLILSRKSTWSNLLDYA